MPKPSQKPKPDARAEKAAQRVKIEAEAAAAEALRQRAAWHRATANTFANTEKGHHEAVAARLSVFAQEFDA